MTLLGQPERATQNRVLALFRDELRYRYLGDWTDRDGNSSIEEGLLSEWLTWSGYKQAQISEALYKLRSRDPDLQLGLLAVRSEGLSRHGKVLRPLAISLSGGRISPRASGWSVRIHTFE
jgi:hypothetical protein